MIFFYIFKEVVYILLSNNQIMSTVRVPDIDHPETLQSTPINNEEQKYTMHQQILRFQHRHDSTIPISLLDSERAIQQDNVPYHTAYLMARMTYDTNRIAMETLNLNYLNEHFINLIREVKHFLSQPGVTWFSLMTYVGFLANQCDTNYLFHDIRVFGSENPETVRLLSRFFPGGQEEEEE